MLFVEEYMLEEEEERVVGFPDQCSKRHAVARPGRRDSSSTSLERLHKLTEAAYLRVVGLKKWSERVLWSGKIYPVPDCWWQRL